MAKNKFIEILNSGPDAWNEWIKKYYPKSGKLVSGDFFEDAKAKIENPDLSYLDLSNRDLSGYNFYYTDFSYSDISNATVKNSNFYRANMEYVKLANSNLSNSRFYHAQMMNAQCEKSNFSNAFLEGTQLIYANLDEAIFKNANLNSANLSKTSLYKTDFSSGNLEGVRFLYSSMVGTIFNDAIINGCRVYGISTWDISLENTIQKDIIITPKKTSIITVDNIEIAQFVYSLVNNAKLRNIIDTITSKVVLILGRFTKGRLEILHKIKNTLRTMDYVPILFDFEGPSNRDIEETVMTLACLSRFIVADITDPRSVPHELSKIVHDLTSVPIQPIMESTESEYGLLQSSNKKRDWLLPTVTYSDPQHLNNIFGLEIIPRLEKKREELISKNT